MSIFGKLRDFVGLNDSAEYDYEYEEMEGEQYQGTYPIPQPQPAAAPLEEERRASTSSSISSSRRPRERTTLGSVNTATGTGGVMEGSVGSSVGNVIGMPNALNGISEVMVMEPRTFEEMPAAIRALKERKSVVLNLTMMDPDQAQRAVDFVAGGTYALDGHQERIGESIFLFTPSCVQVRTQSGVVHEVANQGRSPRISSTMASMWQTEKTQAAQ
ncbi:MAG: cell division protein SepF [Microcoleaceae cyanobacterium]